MPVHKVLDLTHWEVRGWLLFLGEQGFQTQYLEYLVAQLTSVVHNAVYGKDDDPKPPLYFLPRERDSKENKEFHDAKREKEQSEIDIAERNAVMEIMRQRAKARREELGLANRSDL